MSDVAREGRTVLFVSHNMGAIRSLCTRGIVMDRGRVVSDGDISDSIEAYHRMSAETAESNGAGVERAGFTIPRLASHSGRTIDQGDAFEVTTTMRLDEDIPSFFVWCILEDMYQRRIAVSRLDHNDIGDRENGSGAYRLAIKFPALWLEPGLYTLYFRAKLSGANSSERYVSDVLHLDVAGTTYVQNAILNPRTEWLVEAEA